jgi:hypothetical protein
MEWGWMRGMGRDVLYLVEKDFKKQRADRGGLIDQSKWIALCGNEGNQARRG